MKPQQLQLKMAQYANLEGMLLSLQCEYGRLKLITKVLCLHYALGKNRGSDVKRQIRPMDLDYLNAFVLFCVL